MNQPATAQSESGPLLCIGCGQAISADNAAFEGLDICKACLTLRGVTSKLPFRKFYPPLWWLAALSFSMMARMLIGTVAGLVVEAALRALGIDANRVVAGIGAAIGLAFFAKNLGNIVESLDLRVKRRTAKELGFDRLPLDRFLLAATYLPGERTDWEHVELLAETSESIILFRPRQGVRIIRYADIERVGWIGFGGHFRVALQFPEGSRAYIHIKEGGEPVWGRDKASWDFGARINAKVEALRGEPSQEPETPDASRPRRRLRNVLKWSAVLAVLIFLRFHWPERRHSRDAGGTSRSDPVSAVASRPGFDDSMYKAMAPTTAEKEFTAAFHDARTTPTLTNLSGAWTTGSFDPGFDLIVKQAGATLGGRARHWLASAPPDFQDVSGIIDGTTVTLTFSGGKFINGSYRFQIQDTDGELRLAEVPSHSFLRDFRTELAEEKRRDLEFQKKIQIAGEFYRAFGDTRTTPTLTNLSGAWEGDPDPFNMSYFSLYMSQDGAALRGRASFETDVIFANIYDVSGDIEGSTVTLRLSGGAFDNGTYRFRLRQIDGAPALAALHSNPLWIDLYTRQAIASRAARSPQ